MKFSLYRIASDRELLYIDNFSGLEPHDVIKDAVRQYPYLEWFKEFIIAVPHQQVEGFAVGAIFRLREPK